MSRRNFKPVLDQRHGANDTAFRDIGAPVDVVDADRADHGAKQQEVDRLNRDSINRLFPKGRLAGARFEQPP